MLEPRMNSKFICSGMVYSTVDTLSYIECLIRHYCTIKISKLGKGIA